MSKITITILGTTAGVPTRERAHTAIFLCHKDEQETCFLFDCGEGTQRQFLMAGLNMMKIDNMFITHWHGDHCLGIPGMVDTMGFEDRKRPLAIFAPEAGRISKCINSSRSMSKFRVDPKRVPSKGRAVKTLIETERFIIQSTPVRHGVPAVAYAFIEKEKTGIDLKKAESFGLPPKGEVYRQLKKMGRVKFGSRTIDLDEVSITEKGKKIVYSGDTEICGNLRKLAKGADLLIQDCTYFEDMGPEKPHMHASLPDIIKMVEEEGVKRTVLTHISRKYQDIEELKKKVKDIPSIELAEDFTEVAV
jgi:ribonuclease Z